MTGTIGAGRFAFLVALVLLAAACGGGAAKPGKSSPEPAGSPLPERTRSETYDEGKVTIGISLLDVGLVKGGMAAEANGDWRVAAVEVTAADPTGAMWSVLEFPQGVGSSKATEFFEVVLQELPRGKQITITATATFEGTDGAKAERTAADRWPP